MEQSRWSSLPKDMLTTVSKLLNNDIDYLRLGAICTSWRFSLPLPRTKSSFPFSVPAYYPFSIPAFLPKGTDERCDPFHIVQITIYRISCDGNGDADSNGCLIKVVAANPNTFSLLFPSTERITNTSPGPVNLLNYRVSEISRGYYLTSVDKDIGLERRRLFETDAVVLMDYVVGHKKVVLVFPVAQLWAWKVGDKEWSVVEGLENYSVRDIILCNNGKCYVVDNSGVLVMIDSALRPIQVASALNPSELAVPGFIMSDKYLVECEGEIYLVVLIPRNETPGERDGYFTNETQGPMIVKIFKYNVGRSNWENVFTLGKKAFFLGHYVKFSVDAFRGCKGNTVYVVNRSSEQEDYNAENTYVFSLDDGTTTSLASTPEQQEMFWPPQGWFMPDDATSS